MHLSVALDHRDPRLLYARGGHALGSDQALRKSADLLCRPVQKALDLQERAARILPHLILFKRTHDSGPSTVRCFSVLKYASARFYKPRRQPRIFLRFEACRMAVFTGFSSVFSARIRKIVLENRILSCYTFVCKQGNAVSHFLNASFS